MSAIPTIDKLLTKDQQARIYEVCNVLWPLIKSGYNDLRPVAVHHSKENKTKISLTAICRRCGKTIMATINVVAEDADMHLGEYMLSRCEFHARSGHSIVIPRGAKWLKH